MNQSRRLVCLLLLGTLLAGCQKSDSQSSVVLVPDPARIPPEGPGVHQLSVHMPPETTLRYTLSVPYGYDGSRLRPLIVALHYDGEVTPYYGKNMIDVLVKPAFDSLGAIMVAPDALEGGDWTTVTNEMAVVWLIRSLQKSYAIHPHKVLLTGFSMGGQGTWFIASRHKDLFSAALPIAGKPAGSDGGWTIPVYVIHSQNDEVVPLGPTRQHVDALKARGAKVELKAIAGVSHSQTFKYVGAMREAIPWLKRAWGD